MNEQEHQVGHGRRQGVVTAPTPMRFGSREFTEGLFAFARANPWILERWFDRSGPGPGAGRFRGKGVDFRVKVTRMIDGHRITRPPMLSKQKPLRAVHFSPRELCVQPSAGAFFLEVAPSG